MKILYLPIIEPGDNHDTALINKRGLFNAFSKYGETRQLDYLAVPVEDLFSGLMALLDDFQPDILFTQLHGADRLTPDDFRVFRERFPKLICANWSGDSWNHSLVSPAMLDLCCQFDLQLVAAPDVLPIYAEEGISAKFWQIGYEYPVGELPNMPCYDVVFLGNVISEKRRKLLEFLRSLKDVNVGIYGDWEHSDGRNTYDFGAGEALYKNAQIAISDCAYPDQKNYVSNRPIQILMAGGALLLHEFVPKMDELLEDIEVGNHYLWWMDFDNLKGIIESVLSGNVPGAGSIPIAGQIYAREHHTYDLRVAQLFDELLVVRS